MGLQTKLKVAIYVIEIQIKMKPIYTPVRITVFSLFLKVLKIDLHRIGITTKRSAN